jgi:hypothetical protein
MRIGMSGSDVFGPPGGRRRVLRGGGSCIGKTASAFRGSRLARRGGGRNEPAR